MEQGLNHVFESGPRLFNDIPILLKKWQPEAWFEKPIPTEVSIWINIQDMHVTLWNYEILSHIASTIGIPIAVDRYTAEMCEKKTGRGAFARVLVQINSALEIPKFAEAEIRKIVRKLRLEYSWIPPRCLHCKIFGHVLIDCSARPRTEAELTKKVDAAPTAANEDGPSRADDQGFEQPKRRKRRAKTTLNSVIRDPTTSTSGLDTQQGAGKGSPPESNIESRNPYDILDGLNTEIGSSSSITHVEKVPEDSEDEVYEDDNPTAQFMKADK
ncbi:hypothetical protein CTI12_AA507630 [Artemisia annua]|uniref:Uncharacterized protein n=1 Tax=Artemisia annua TaxID=35608 RepID=A0A2U1LC27_ARTAN|nr:hypothetical protein CTI12_AA507630 [Artemisia annua]